MNNIFLAVTVAGAVWASPEPARTAQPGGPRAPDVVVARVNGEPVTDAELRRMRDNPLTRQQLEQELGSGRSDPERLDRLALRKVVHLRLLVQEGARRGITVTQKDLDDTVTSLRRRFEDLRGFGAWMMEQGLDDRSLFGAVGDDLLADRVRTALAAEARVGNEDVQRYYEAHRAELRRAEVRLQIIAVSDRAAAEEVVAALRKGEAFNRVAWQRSEGLRATQGGDTGWVNPAGLEPLLREAAMALKPGEARGPMRRGEEFLVVRLAARRPGPPMSLANARPEIERRLLPEKQKQAVDAWLTEQEAKSTIELLTGSTTTMMSRATPAR